MKKVLLLVISLLLTLGMAVPACAGTGADTEVTVYDPDTCVLESDLPASEGWIQPGDITENSRSTSSIAYMFKKTSSTSCKAQVTAARPGATYVKSTLSVQIKNDNGYKTITNGTAVKSVNGNFINHIATYSISSRKTYRLKIAIAYKEDGNTITDYYYKALDSNGY